MAQPGTLPAPVFETAPTGLSGRYMVVIFNNDHTAFDTVVDLLVRATECPLEEAQMETWEAHNFGFAPVHFGGESMCREVASIIGSEGVRADVRKEWDD